SVPGGVANSLITAVTAPSNDRGGGLSSGPTRSATPGRATSSAATAWRQNRAGSLSPASSDSHATGRPSPPAQSASSAVLPDPAGSADQAPPPRQPLAERLHQPRTWHKSRMDAGHVQLGGQQHIRPLGRKRDHGRLGAWHRQPQGSEAAIPG